MRDAGKAIFYQSYLKNSIAFRTLPRTPLECSQHSPRPPSCLWRVPLPIPHIPPPRRLWRLFNILKWTPLSKILNLSLGCMEGLIYYYKYKNNGVHAFICLFFHFINFQIYRESNLPPHSSSHDLPTQKPTAPLGQPQKDGPDPANKLSEQVLDAFTTPDAWQCFDKCKKTPTCVGHDIFYLPDNILHCVLITLVRK